MNEKYQEYKCPKCNMWDDGFSIIKGTIKCSNPDCKHIGTLKEFEAKRYSCYAQIIVYVIAFDEKDAKKEFDIIVKDNHLDLEGTFDKLIKIEEER